MSIDFAFVGFRHGHVFGLLKAVEARDGLRVVARCEENPADSLADAGDITHQDFGRMLAEVECDVVAIGDTYGRRGALAIAAMEAGRHVISDKPLCTRPKEWERIRDLATAGGLVVGCQFDLRANPCLRRLQRLIAEGELGEVHTVNVTGQHPLLRNKRPGWYFEPGAHGGTLNDIAAHAVDAIPWLTGRRVAAVVAARAWNAKTPDVPHFQDAAQFMLRLDNDGGVLGDMSYLAPDGAGYRMENYWRFLIHGTEGQAQATLGGQAVQIVRHDDKEPRLIDAEAEAGGAYLDDFLDEVRGERPRCGLDTGTVLRSAQVGLLLQQAADTGQANLPC